MKRFVWSKEEPVKEFRGECLTLMDPRHNYYQKVLDLVGPDLLKGIITDVDVLHDDRCKIYQGDFCNCEPEVRIRSDAKQR